LPPPLYKRMQLHNSLNEPVLVPVKLVTTPVICCVPAIRCCVGFISITFRVGFTHLDLALLVVRIYLLMLLPIQRKTVDLFFHWIPASERPGIALFFDAFVVILLTPQDIS